MKALASLLLLASLPWNAAAQAPQAELLSVKKIWDEGKHNAFTDLIEFKGLLFCSFRESEAHVGGDGMIRIMLSSTGENWVPYATIAEKGIDLRDPKLAITPDQKRLYCLMGGSIYNGTTLTGRQPRYATSFEGKDWTPPLKLLSEGDWLWRATLHPTENKFYGVSYNCYPTTGGPKFEAEWSLKLYSSLDGSVWQLAAPLNVTGQPNESTIRFLKDGTAVMLVRRESGDHKGMIGTAKAPYREWTWTPLNVPLGGPNFIELPDGSLIAGSRGFGKTPGAHMVLFKMTPTSLEPILELPSAGDCSYPGLVWKDNVLWVSYYSTHEANKTAVYIAKVRLPWVK